jgi:hypothetical protein
MKAFFISILALLLSMAIVRFAYGLEPNQSQYIFDVILSLPPDISEEYKIVIAAGERFVASLESLGSVVSSGKDIFQVVKAFFTSFAALKGFEDLIIVIFSS